jgi:hypothetical protein
MGTNKSKAALFRVEILRAGQFTAADGKPIDLSHDKLKQMVGSYDPSYHEALVNCDHAENGPALGRVSRLHMEGDKVLADLLDVDSEVAREMVQGGQWPNRSAEIYHDLEGRGPYLRALAILGAHPPAIKGLQRITPGSIQPQPAFAFSESDDGQSQVFTYSTLEEDTSMPETIAPETAALKEQLSQKEAKLAEAEAKLAELADKDAEIVKLEEEKAALTESVKEHTAQVKLAEAKTRATTKFVQLKEERRITPGMEQAGIADMLTAIELMEEPVAVGGKEYKLGELIGKVLAAVPQMPAPGEQAPAKPSDQDVTLLNEFDEAFANRLFTNDEQRKAYLADVSAKRLTLLNQKGGSA